MSNYALISNREVVNVIVWDGVIAPRPEDFPEDEPWRPFPEGLDGELVACGDEAVQIGWGYDGTKFVAPPPPPAPPPAVPVSISKRQAHRALLDAGLLDLAEAKIAAIEDPKARRVAQIEWDSQVYERSSVFLATFAGELGLSAAQLDALFIQAAAL